MALGVGHVGQVGRWAALVGFLWTSPAAAEISLGSSWAVMPVVGSETPPGDPTLGRMTARLGQTIFATSRREVRVLGHSAREALCDRGHNCGSELAGRLSADWVLVSELGPKMDRLKLKVFSRDRGLVAEADSSCSWHGGQVYCEAPAIRSLADRLDRIGGLDIRADSKTLANRKGDQGSAAGLTKSVLTPSDQVKAEFARCRSESPVARKPRGEEVVVQFRARPNGEVSHVQIQPVEREAEPAYACLAYSVEGIRLQTTPDPDAQVVRVSLQ
jgi:hypothetical protein